MQYRFLALAGFLIWTAGVEGATVSVFGENTPWKYFKGTSEASSPTTAWRLLNFSDASWLTGNAPFFYEASTGYSGNTDLPDMQAGYTCIFMRKVINLPPAGSISEITLHLRSDDGAIVWINGTRVATLGAIAGEPVFNDVALDASGEPKDMEFVIPNPSSFLMTGNNLVAIQAFNGVQPSSDFLIAATLTYTADDVAPSLISITPPASAIVQELTFITVEFSENVLGVDRTDLLINGTAAASLNALSGKDYQFNFPQPANGQVTVQFANGHGIMDVNGNAFGGQMWTYTLDPNASGSVVLINEFMADNAGGIRDEDSDREDWIELLNLGPLKVDLNGWFLTDDAANLTKWRLPSVSLFANEYLLVWASGKDRTNVLGQLHTNFKLSPSGEYLALVDDKTNVVSAFAPTYPAQNPNISYGRDRLNPSLTGYFSTATPRAANAAGGPGFAPEPVFSIQGGIFTNSDLTLTLSAPSGTIRYTLDGTNPTESSPVYSAPISITTSRQVRARTFQTGLLPSAVIVKAYNLIGNGLAGFTSKLPILVFNTGGANVPQDVPPGGNRVLSSLVVIDPYRGQASLTDKPHFVGLSQMEIRGQTSAGFPKKPYRLELNDFNGNDLDFPLLGMPADSDWILRNPYSDKSFLNDYLAFESYEKMGNYSVRRRFVEVFVDTNGGKLDYPGDYVGIEVLLETIKVNGHRVDVERLGPNDNSMPNISGGYIWKKDKDSTGDRNFSTAGGNGFPGEGLKIHEPKPREITSTQLSWLQTYLNTMESKLYAANWLTATGTNHWSYYIDQDSFVDQHWIVEFPKQIDGYRLSNYMSKDRGGKIRMTPIWDWNLSYGNADYLDGGHVATWYYGLVGAVEHIWLRRLITGVAGGAGVAGDPDFVQAIIDRWGVLRTNVMNGSNLVARVEEIYSLLNQSAARDFSKWPRLGTYIWPNPNGGSWNVDYVGPTTYRGIIDEKVKWITGRYQWIDGRRGAPGEQTPGAPASPIVSQPGGNVGAGATVSLGAAGVVYYTMNGTDPRASGGGMSASAQLYSGPITINGNARVVARAYNSASMTPWSAPVAATYIVETPPLIITEMMFHPLPPALGDTNDVDNYQYIELKNIGSTTLNLAGYRFVNGIQFDFSLGSVPSLPVGGKVVLVRNAGAFAARYPGVANVAGEFQGTLSHSGERITLLGPALETVHDFDYEDDWYPGADGLGFALVVANENQPRQNWDFKIGWRTGALHGTPGQDDGAGAMIPGVLITEALTHTDLPDVDSIELFNPTGSPVNVGGWYLSDDLGTPKFRIPTGTMIQPNLYITFTEAQFNQINDPAGFNLRSSGDEVYLFSADGAGNLTGYVQGYDFGASLNGVSFGRHSNSVGKVFFVAQSSGTLGSANAGPRVGPVVITEINYAPPDVFVNGAFWNNTEHEFVELYNLSGQPVSLNGTTNTWRLDGGIEYAFPSNITMSVGEHVLVVNFDPVLDVAAANEFRARFGLGATPRLFGPFKGNLSNSGESVRLIQPDVVRFYTNDIVVTSVLMDEVEYSDATPWPVAADGIGSSLQKIAANSFGNDPANWAGARPSPGAQYVPGPAPNITQQPTDQTAVASQSATFEVGVAGAGPFSYQWRFNGSNLNGATNPVLTLSNLQPSQAGQYQVVVLNQANSASSDFATLTVLIPASITANPQSQDVPSGTNVTLSVAATSSTPITYQWLKDGFPIMGATASTLNFPSIHPNDAGLYTVRVKDAVGTVTSAPAKIVVLVDPIVVVQPIGATNMVGGSVILSVQVTNTATLPVGYRWRRGGQNVTTRVSNSRTDFLILQNLQTTDAGSYSVVVTNSSSFQPGVLSGIARVGVVTTGIDNDGDGLPNDWEIAHGLNPNSAADAGLDTDMDGYSNHDEYMAGTDPQDANSFLKVETVSATGGATLRFMAAENRTYSVQYRDAISGAGVWQTFAGVPIQNSGSSAMRMVTISDTRPPVPGERYYRLVAPGVPGEE